MKTYGADKKKEKRHVRKKIVHPHFFEKNKTIWDLESSTRTRSKNTCIQNLWNSMKYSRHTGVNEKKKACSKKFRPPSFLGKGYRRLKVFIGNLPLCLALQKCVNRTPRSPPKNSVFLSFPEIWWGPFFRGEPKWKISSIHLEFVVWKELVAVYLAPPTATICSQKFSSIKNMENSPNSISISIFSHTSQFIIRNIRAGTRQTKYNPVAPQYKLKISNKTLAWNLCHPCSFQQEIQHPFVNQLRCSRRNTLKLKNNLKNVI